MRSKEDDSLRLELFDDHLRHLRQQGIRYVDGGRLGFLILRHLGSHPRKITEPHCSFDGALPQERRVAGLKFGALIETFPCWSSQDAVERRTIDSAGRTKILRLRTSTRASSSQSCATPRAFQPAGGPPWG